MTQSFFLDGPADDPAYVNVRDLSHLAAYRAFTESLWPHYKHLADDHFLADARNHFLQRFWEMYLACTLIDRGFELHRHGGEGPEFFFNDGAKRVWVEAIAPTAGTGADKVPATVPGECFTTPVDKIVLRFTSALHDKRKKVEIAMAKSIVKRDDAVLLALNSRAIPHAPYGAEMPYIVKAMLPFGALTIGIDRQTRKAVETYHQYRPELLKSNQSPVSTMPFLDPAYSMFTGVIHSGVDCANRPDEMGKDFYLLHNPTAAHSLSPQLFSWGRQVRYVDGALEELP